MPNMNRNLLVWLVIGLFVFAAANFLQGDLDRTGGNRIAFSDFLGQVESGDVKDVTILKSPTKGTSITGRLGDDTVFMTEVADYPGLIDTLRGANVKINVVNEDQGGSFLGTMLLYLFPTLLFIAFYVYFWKQVNGKGGGGAMSFGRSKAKLLNDKFKKVTFKDVAGIDEAQEELQELVDFLKDPGKFQRLGGKIPRGCLLVGPPGTGKTLLARAIAGEADVPFFSISGSDFVEMFVGVGASRVRDMFAEGKKNSPCIIFIDEIDAVGRHRGAGMGGGNDEREQTLNQLLVEMDGFEENESVIIIAATNRPDVLDKALLRPGRFDRQIVVPNPDINGRTKILDVHLKKVPQGPDVDSKTIARGTPGFSGADLANLVNEAALLAARRGKKVITMNELEDAKDKVMMGTERKSMVMTDDEKKMTAYHEAGHAIVSLEFPASDPIHKATIIPRGRALGMVVRLPEADKVSYLREKMHADLAVSMGGRVAEEIIFGYEKVSSGASSDIKYATQLARAMVKEWGMSDKVGPLDFGDNAQESYMGSYGGPAAAMSDETAKILDAEIKTLVEDAHKAATETLNKRMDDLHLLAKSMLERETLTGEEIDMLMDGKELPPLNDNKEPVKAVKSSLPSKRKKIEAANDDEANDTTAEKPAANENDASESSDKPDGDKEE